MVGHHHHHLQMPHLGVQLQKAQGLGSQPVLEPRLAVHLQLQLHHRLPRGAGQAPLRPEHTVEAMVHGFQLHRLEAVELIPGRFRAKAGRWT